jgi:prepilin-type N-terminal cleavage/methylation domain-containing protein
MVNKMKKGFTLIELLIVVVIVGILALAAIPLITSNTRDARRAEGEQLLGSARDATRVQYSKNGTAPATISSFQTLAGFEGKYFKIVDTITATATTGAISTNAGAGSDGTGTITFQWASGQSTIVWA